MVSFDALVALARPLFKHFHDEAGEMLVFNLHVVSP
jgi:hypothetical protein